MENQNLKNEAKKLRSDGKTYKEISSILNVSLFSAKKMCTYILNKSFKMGPNPKVTKKVQFRIKGATCNLEDSGEKFISRKIIEACDIDISIRTVQRHLKAMQYKYKRATAIISLTKHIRQKE